MSVFGSLCIEGGTEVWGGAQDGETTPASPSHVPPSMPNQGGGWVAESC